MIVLSRLVWLYSAAWLAFNVALKPSLGRADEGMPR